MAKYSDSEANNIIDNGIFSEQPQVGGGLSQPPAGGCILKEEWSIGCEEEDEEGNPVTNFVGWRVLVLDGNGFELEFLLENTPQNATEATRRADAKARIKTIERCIDQLS